MSFSLTENYTNAATITFSTGTLASSSASPPAGALGAIIDNSSNLFTHFSVSGTIVLGAAAVAAGYVTMYLVPYDYDGSTLRGPAGASTTGDTSFTPTLANFTGTGIRLLTKIATPATNSFSLSFTHLEMGFDRPPYKWALFLTHSTSAALTSVVLRYTGQKFNSP